MRGERNHENGLATVSMRAEPRVWWTRRRPCACSSRRFSNGYRFHFCLKEHVIRHLEPPGRVLWRWKSLAFYAAAIWKSNGTLEVLQKNSTYEGSLFHLHIYFPSLGFLVQINFEITCGSDVPTGLEPAWLDFSSIWITLITKRKQARLVND
jgi:hypothetical protein